MLSSTVRQGRSVGFWKTMAILSGRGPVIATPSTEIVPVDAAVSPPIMNSRVVLPQPLGPIRLANIPSSTANETSASAVTWPWPAPRVPGYTLLT